MPTLTASTPQQAPGTHAQVSRGHLRTAGTWITWALVSVVAVALVAVIVVPKVLGWVPLTVLTGSMTPTIPIGSQVVVERVHGNTDLARLEPGQIITFLPKPDSGMTVTHRIVAKTTDPNGTVRLRTKGDANNAEDPWELTSKQVRGQVKYWVPYVGYAATALPQEQKDTGIWIAACALFGYAGWQLIGAPRPGRRRPKSARRP
ncbi:MAG TPA: signal peptidase I [Marmoricola sp.]|nr:signal peptidase I [Nocardioidaceae bacterium]MCB8993499.1 signal peptidase I [Nocardioidaceae bacterium]MCO5323301.1 signal peptidase I [Nocardioidaceae bacterium]HRV69936.1 signal peptidase I [Marmoricola sp.]